MHRVYSKLYGAAMLVNLGGTPIWRLIYEVSQKPTDTKNIDQNGIDKHTYSLTFSWFPLEGGNNEIMHQFNSSNYVTGVAWLNYFTDISGTRE